MAESIFMAAKTVTPNTPATSAIFASTPECARPRALQHGKSDNLGKINAQCCSGVAVAEDGHTPHNA
ncbi:MAG TPA: hypothetical protein VFC17_06695 [Candidatus Limnocylindrales bacterium]|nr:hypothetical protein [Candidatus Limnocylindrales bacterium]